MNRLTTEEFTEYYFEPYSSRNDEHYYYVRNFKTKTNGKNQKDFNKYQTHYRWEDNQVTNQF